MNKLFQHIQGDRTIWAVVALLGLFSFLPVYSSSSNLAYLYGNGNTLPYLVKHGVHLMLGILIIYGVHKIPYRYFKGLSIIFLPLVVILLAITLAKDTTIDGANASRWIQIPFVGITFQTSSLAMVVLMVYVARYLSKIHGKPIQFKETILPLWVPVFVVLMLILPANFSTTAIIFCMVLVLMFLGGYPLKYLGVILGVGLLALTLFVLTAKAFPGLMPNRVDTWTSRIENFAQPNSEEEGYQIEKAKIAIASGGLVGLGPGKSVQKNFLPQSSSDFIYAVIVEEFGLAGALLLLVFYLMLLFRLLLICNKAGTTFGKLLVIAVGLPIVFQAFINMAVAVGLFPVTGQTLPLISSGGSSIWMTCLALGIVLSVSAQRAEPVEASDQTEEEQNPLEILSQTV